MSHLPRIAWFSPVNPGIESLAYYSTRAIVPHLRERFDIVLFTEGDPRADLGVAEDHFLNARRRHRDHPFDLVLYNIDDGPASRFARAHLGLLPGIVWLHHAALSDLGAEAFHSSPWEFTLERFLDPAAPFNQRGNPVHPLWPLAYRERSLATLLLCSSRNGIRQLEPLSGRRLEAYPGGHRILHLPVPCLLASSPPPFPTGGTLTIASAARAGIEGQMHKVFLAVRALRAPWRIAWMVDTSEAAAARDLIAEFDVGDHTTLITERSPEIWGSLLADHCVAVHLHNSPFHAVAPYLEISLGTGRPTIVSGYPGITEVGEEVAFRVEPGGSMGAQLQRLLEFLSSADLPKIGEKGWRYARARLSPEIVADQLASLITEHAPAWRSIMRRWDAIARSAEEELRHDAAKLIAPSSNDETPNGEVFIETFFSEFGR